MFAFIGQWGWPGLVVIYLGIGLLVWAVVWLIRLLMK